MKKVLYLLTIAVFTLSLITSCREEKSPKEKIEDGIEEIGDGIEDGAEEVEDAVEDATKDN